MALLAGLVFVYWIILAHEHDIMGSQFILYKSVGRLVDLEGTDNSLFLFQIILE